MRFVLFFTIQIALSFSAYAQQSGFILKGHLSKAGGKKIYLSEQAFYKNNNGKDSVVADKSGNFIFRGKVSEPAMYMVQTSLNNQPLFFFLENSEIQINGNADTLYAARVTGSKEELIRLKYDSLIRSFGYNALDQRRELAKENGDTAEVRKKTIELRELARREWDAKKVLMKQYPFATASVNQIDGLMASRQMADLKTVDSLLTLYESSPIKTSGQVQFFRKAWKDAQKSAIGVLAEDFSQPDTSGRPVTLSSFKGRYVLVDFWASWCAPCRHESPALTKAFADFSAKNFTILSVSLDRNKAQWLKAIEKDQLNWTHVSDLKFWDNKVAKQYAVSGIPFNMLVDPQGKIMALNLRGDDLHDFLKSNLP